MARIVTPEEIERVARSLVEARESAMGIEVTTPIVHANGDFVEVVVAGGHSGIEVHDAGIGSMRLAAEGMRTGGDVALRMRLAAERYECLVEGGRVLRRCDDDPDAIAVSIALVANASRTVGDFAAEVRRQSESQFRFVLTERLREIAGPRLKENETFKGRSGRVYRVPNVILDKNLALPLAFAVPLASRSSVPVQFRELFDLKAAFPDIRNESIYNDASDFRPDEDGWILAQVGEVIPFSDLSRTLPALLGAA